LSPLVYRYDYTLDGITWERGCLAMPAPEIRVRFADYRLGAATERPDAPARHRQTADNIDLCPALADGELHLVDLFLGRLARWHAKRGKFGRAMALEAPRLATRTRHATAPASPYSTLVDERPLTAGAVGASSPPSPPPEGTPP
jgi:hypothetical protein